jgi:hypothetical protein
MMMSRKKAFTDSVADVLRFCAYLFLLVDVIILSVFLFWFWAKGIWFSAHGLDRIVCRSRARTWCLDTASRLYHGE